MQTRQGLHFFLLDYLANFFIFIPIMKYDIWIGIDIGSVSVQLAVFIESEALQCKFESPFRRFDTYKKVGKQPGRI